MSEPPPDPSHDASVETEGALADTETLGVSQATTTQTALETGSWAKFKRWWRTHIWPREPDFDHSEMSNDTAAMWFKAAEEMTPLKTLESITNHSQFVITTVATVGTLLAGIGGAIATISITRTTFYWNAIPVVPIGALVTSALAGVAVVVALNARAPDAGWTNVEVAEEIRHRFNTVIERRVATVRMASSLVRLSALFAVLTSFIAGLLVILEPAAGPNASPRNLSSLSATVGDKGVVTIKVGGAVDRLEEEERVHVTVTADSANQQVTLIDVTVHPDADGKASITAEALAPAGSAAADAVVVVQSPEACSETKKDDGSTFCDEPSETMRTTYAPVPAANTDTEAAAPALSITATIIKRAIQQARAGAVVLAVSPKKSCRSYVVQVQRKQDGLWTRAGIRTRPDEDCQAVATFRGVKSPRIRLVLLKRSDTTKTPVAAKGVLLKQ